MFFCSLACSLREKSRKTSILRSKTRRASIDCFTEWSTIIENDHLQTSLSRVTEGDQLRHACCFNYSLVTGAIFQSNRCFNINEATRKELCSTLLENEYIKTEKTLQYTFILYKIILSIFMYCVVYFQTKEINFAIPRCHKHSMFIFCDIYLCTLAWWVGYEFLCKFIFLWTQLVK